VVSKKKGEEGEEDAIFSYFLLVSHFGGRGKKGGGKRVFQKDLKKGKRRENTKLFPLSPQRKKKVGGEGRERCLYLPFLFKRGGRGGRKKGDRFRFTHH